MNPFTKYLRQWSHNSSFEEFVEQWDRLEQIVISVYRKKMSINNAASEFDDLWSHLRQDYPQWENVLRPFWQQTKTGGQTTQTDPFQLLLSIQSVEAIQGSWNLMQHLPAAREAINHYLRQNS